MNSGEDLLHQVDLERLRIEKAFRALAARPHGQQAARGAAGPYDRTTRDGEEHDRYAEQGPA